MASGKITAKRPNKGDDRDTRRTAAVQAQRVFAPSLNAVTWALMQKPDRTPEENDKMLYAAFASAFHYNEVGHPEHLQRAEWLISRVYCVLGNAEEALRHAKRCLDLTEEHDAHMDDYDIAFAYEAMARANAVAGNRDEAKQFHAQATKAGHAIDDPGHRKVFDDELKSGNWHGVA